MAAQSSPMLPGRLGTPAITLADDPRADPRMLAAMAPIGLGGPGLPPPVTADAPIGALVELLGAAEAGLESLFTILGTGTGATVDVLSTVEVIRGLDGNDITLYVHRPRTPSGPLPGLIHLHGGGMVMLEAAGPGFTQWRKDLAATGMVVVGVEFRNGAGKLGPYPFPAGLNDCASAVQWVTDNTERLGITKVVISGDSGGGNLTLATALKAKHDGRLAQIDGVYALCPYISNGYANPPMALTSLYENDGYLLRNDMMAIMARVYDPGLDNATNPLAWPYHASADDVRGLPPHVISVNQLDPLRDEGLAYFRTLLDGGVSAVSRTVNGTCHAGDCMFAVAMPDVYMATIRDIHGFATSL